MKPLALVDIDGVLANDDHRVEFALAKEWAEYFNEDRMAADPVLPQGRMLVENLIADGWDVEYLTGRREDRRETTRSWLDAEHFQHPLNMRPAGMKKVLAVFKAEYLAKLLADNPGRRVVLFDDDPEVIRYTREAVGAGYAVHCTWHTKKVALVRAARS